MTQQRYENLPLNQIKAVSNYRKSFDKGPLRELANSIKENGVLEPIIVRPNGTGFQIVAGERRVRAAEMAKLATIPATIPAMVREMTDLEFNKFQLIENIQREDVQYMEEAEGVKNLRDKHALDVDEIARMLGLSVKSVYNSLKLTEMDTFAKKKAMAGELNKTVAVLISRLPEKEQQLQAASDLARKSKDKLITERSAREYITQIFGEKRKVKPNPIKKINGNDYKMNWKHYLVNFGLRDFQAFKDIVRGRTDVPTISEAVEAVMLEKNKND